MRAKYRISFVLSLLLMLLLSSMTVEASKLSRKTLSISAGEKASLQLIGNKKKVKWKSSNKSVATVSSKGVVKGRRIGKCKITATVGKKKYTCRVSVKKFNKKRYTTVVQLTKENFSQYLKFARIHNPISTIDEVYTFWINRDYYCYGCISEPLLGRDDTYTFFYDLHFDVIMQDGSIEHEVIPNLNCGNSGGTNGYNDHNNFNYQMVLTQVDYHGYITLFLIKKSAVKRIESLIDNHRERLILLDGTELDTIFRRPWKGYW